MRIAIKKLITTILCIVISQGLSSQTKSLELALSSKNVSDIAHQKSGLLLSLSLQNSNDPTAL